MRHWLFLPLLFPIFSWSGVPTPTSGASCPMTPPIRFKAFSEEFLREIELQKMQNPHEYCNNAMMLRYLNAPSRLNFKKPTAATIDEAIQNGGLKELFEETALKEYNSFEPKDTFGGPNVKWNSSLMPMEKAKLFSTKVILTSVHSEKKNIPDQLDLDRVEKLLDIPECDLELYTERKDRKKISPAQLGVPLKALVKPYACAEILGLWRANECNSSFDVIERIATPSVGDLTGEEIFRKVLTDDRYTEGLKLAAKKIAARVRVQTSEKANLFGDLSESFAEAGQSGEAAEEMAWSTLGLLASSGPHLEVQLTQLNYGDLDSPHKRASLAIIESSLPILDFRSSANGHIYSLPENIKSGCNTGKSYHFWYVAYLARRAALESGNSEAAAAVAFQSEKLYQLFHRELQGEIAKTNGLYSPRNQIIRTDLVLGAAGAVFGAAAASSTKLPSLNVDEGLKELVSHAGKGQAGSAVILGSKFSTSANKYEKWTSDFSPNTAFNHYANVKFNGKVRKQFLDFEATPKARAPCK